MKHSWKIAAIVAAATVGDGIFALPYVILRSGWALGLLYMAVLGSIVIVAHVIYLETLEKNGEKKRLLGLAKEHLGRTGFWVGFLSIVIGLFLVLVAYLVLGGQFVRLAAPSLPSTTATVIFWAAVSIPLFLSDRRIVALEVLGIALTTTVILFIFFTALPAISFRGAPAWGLSYFFLPFGAILFSLAGWTGIEPAYEANKRAGMIGGAGRGVALGTLFAAVLKVVFVLGVLSSAPIVTSDTVSGLIGWPLWKREFVAALGLFAIWTIFLPISREIKNSLEKDLGWDKNVSRTLIVALPLLLVFLGFNNFLFIVEIVGGVFLSIQYLLIILVGRRALRFGAWQKLFLDASIAVFAIAAVYQIYTFVVH